jgi:hypothetical protein
VVKKIGRLGNGRRLAKARRPDYVRTLEKYQKAE